MSTIKILATAEVGKRIDKLLASAADVSADLHAVMIQCALHVREHGDTGLAQRLTDGISADNNNKSKSAAILDQAGIRLWFGMACPMVVDRATKKWKLMDKASETYTKYVDRMLRHTVSEDEQAKLKADKDHKLDLSTSQPDETSGPGGRTFFVDYMAQHPFWTNGDVQANQNRTIRVSGLDGVIGLAFGIQRQVDRMIEAGTLLPDSIPAVNEFIGKINQLAADFKAQHAIDIVGEGAKIKAFKLKLEAGEVASEATDAGVPQDQQPEVGGDVTTGLDNNPDEQAPDLPNTGTEG